MNPIEKAKQLFAAIDPIATNSATTNEQIKQSEEIIQRLKTEPGLLLLSSLLVLIHIVF